ncbi:MAG: hypothetical protein ACTSUE_05495 [Promethearchaeota archaeon]
MMGNTHAVIAMIPAILLFWKGHGGTSVKHGRFMIFALFSGLLIDFDFLSGMFQQLYTNNLPASFSEFYSIGRQAHPIFTHNFITFTIATIGFVIGLVMYRRKGSGPGSSTETSLNPGHEPGRHERGRGWMIPLVMVSSTVIPILFLQIPTRVGPWQVVNDGTWQYDLVLACIFLAGIVLSIFLNIRRPLYLIVFGLGIMLHILCDVIEYWVLLLGPFDPAWFSGDVPPMAILDLYDFDRNFLLGILFEGPPHVIFVVYVIWYINSGRKKISKRYPLLT